MKQIKIFCPATVSNLSCGFDVLGLCLDNVGDEMIIRKSEKPGIRISRITGADLSQDPEKNVAGIAALAMLSEWETDFGFDIEIHKKIKAGSGIGSSAASAAGAVFGINQLLGRPFDNRYLIKFAMQGEKFAGGSAHADNVAPALLGGIALIRSYNPLDVISIAIPAELYVSVVHPQIELKTSDSRAVLKKEIPLKAAVAQWGNVGGLIAGFYTADYDLIGRSLQDEVAEPYRRALIPGFSDAKLAAMQSGALGAGISGSGPSMFALSKGRETAEKVTAAMSEVYAALELPYEAHVSGINKEGIKIIEQS
jgi:homoserine kinase